MKKFRATEQTRSSTSPGWLCAQRTHSQHHTPQRSDDRIGQGVLPGRQERTETLGNRKHNPVCRWHDCMQKTLGDLKSLKSVNGLHNLKNTVNMWKIIFLYICNDWKSQLKNPSWVELSPAAVAQLAGAPFCTPKRWGFDPLLAPAGEPQEFLKHTI